MPFNYSYFYFVLSNISFIYLFFNVFSNISLIYLFHNNNYYTYLMIIYALYPGDQLLELGVSNITYMIKNKLSILLTKL